MFSTLRVMPDKKPLSVRIREAGGLYSFLNSRLIKFAGPASVGPYESTPVESSVAKACPLCGHPMNEHEFDRSGPKPLMHCPS
ncbi:hypothetical protein KTJ77_05885 [Microbacterium sp. NC79]|nr:hypothetical protein [Microbacterium sp. NC79]